MAIRFISAVAITAVQVHGLRYPANKVCVTNWLNEEIYMEMAGDTFGPASSLVGPIASGVEQCEDLDKWLQDPTPGVDFEVASWYGGVDPHAVPADNVFFAEPYITYATNGQTVKYV